MSIAQWADIEIRRGKSSQASVSWGRRLLQSIDNDDFLGISQLMDKGLYPEADIDMQTNSDGYAGYLWTVLIHNFLGDTALHFALRQKRLNCVYMLLLLDADPLISNAKQQTAASLCQQIYGQTHLNMKFDARRRLVNASQVEQLQALPALFRAKNAEKEAWRLMQEGRLLYSELPKALQPSRQIDIDTITELARKKLSHNFPYETRKIGGSTNNNEQGRREEFDGVNASNLTAAEEGRGKAEVVVNEANLKWRKMTTDDGHVYFFNHETGESSWEAPAGWSDALDLSDVDPAAKVSVTTNINNTADSFARIVMSIGPTKKGKTDRDHLMMSRFMADRAKKKEKKASVEEKAVKLMIDDVWSKGTVVDVVQLVERQKRNFEMRVKPPDQFIAKGLSLLDTVRIGNVLEQTAAKEKLLQVGRRDVVWELPDNLQNSVEGLKKLTFLDGTDDLQRMVNKVSGSKFASSSSMKVASNISDKIIFQSEVNKAVQESAGLQLGHSTSFRYLSHEDDNSLANRAKTNLLASGSNAGGAESIRSESYASNDLNSVEEGSKVLATRSNVLGKDLWRDITEISTYTNMKYMQIGDEGVATLATALQGDFVIHKLCLAHSHITDIGATAVAKVLPSIHGLKYLDLSSNSICDKGAVNLAKALEEQYFQRARLEGKLKKDSELYISKNHAELGIASMKCTVRRISVAGNRIGIKGILAIVTAILKSHNLLAGGKIHRRTRGIDWCSIRNNQLHNVDKESIIKLLEENNFVLESNGACCRNRYFREEGRHRYVLHHQHHRRGALHRNLAVSKGDDRDKISRLFLSARPNNKHSPQLEEQVCKEDEEDLDEFESVPSNVASKDFNSNTSLQPKSSDLNQESHLSASSVSELHSTVSERAPINTLREARPSRGSQRLEDEESMTESSSDHVSSSSQSSNSGDEAHHEIDVALFQSQRIGKKQKYLCVIVI